LKKQKIIAIYGKGGIGKSSTASNVAAACAETGKKVMIIGCDPKSDSSITLFGGKRIPTVLDLMRNGVNIKEEDVVFEGFAGVKCVEAGGPTQSAVLEGNVQGVVVQARKNTRFPSADMALAAEALAAAEASVSANKNSLAALRMTSNWAVHVVSLTSL